ncbi:uncharacterized protein LOC128735618 [Sabethes cyaneus]|uniref:uncharacterized protein LOC128735618 n=1 Tax=Sabethes cyaneus TaxID=53552 RepID=UPI00237EE131|nr:uncharacterized protein LOC128735618 [Sabethes cyaneus]
MAFENRRILEALGEVDNTTCKSLALGGDKCVERVLGILWTPTTDELSFSTQMSMEVQTLLNNGDRPTKRQILRCVMSLFDPLGLLSPFVVHGKVLIQNTWRTGAEWDQKVDDVSFELWQKWIKMIDFICTVRIPRCYFKQATAETYSNTQMHVFVDANEKAYACAVYFRTVDIDGYAQCALLAGKAKVAPVKPRSVSRLELQGCELGVRLAKHLQDHHCVPITKRFFWTDSTTALSWIRADPRNYRPFVAHCIGRILDLSHVNEWRWISSKLNPADEATKLEKGPYFSDKSKWFVGPDFLRLPEEEWPRPVQLIVATTEESRTSAMFHAAGTPVIRYERYSRWERLHRAMGYVFRFMNNTRSGHLKVFGQLQQNELQAASDMIFKQVQYETYTEEIMILEKNESKPETQRQAIDKDSSLYQFMPVIDDRGVLRQGSRARKAEHMPFDARYPILLPKDHPVTMLLVDYYHRVYRHANLETVVNEMRQRYMIPRLRVVIKTVSRMCQYCKLRRSKPGTPPMAPLPSARLAYQVRPFSYTGVDYFGPLSVKVGRSNVKRWIALFTCLTIRAVHLEVAYDLSTASCIRCVRRFVGRRGPPVEFFSDNGTNFQGAERILREQINVGLSATFTSAATKWNFIPQGPRTWVVRGNV